MLDIQVEGLAQTEAVLERVQKTIREPKLPNVQTATIRDLRVYPPPPPNSTYVRTGHLRRSWNIAYSHGRQATLFSFVNPAVYAVYVQGLPSEQASIHRGRWTPARAIIERHQAGIVKEWEAELEDAAEGH